MIPVSAAVALLPLLPGLVDSILKIVKAVRTDPQTPEDIKRELDEVAFRLEEAKAAVSGARLPAARLD